MYTQAASRTHRAIDSRADDEPELIESKAGPLPTSQRVELPMDLFFSRPANKTDDVGEALGGVVFHLSNGSSHPGPERQLQASPVIGDLSEMPADLLDMVAGFVPHEDIVNLAMVCKTWRDSLNRPGRNRITGLMDRAIAEPSYLLHKKAIDQLVTARFETLSRTAVARLHALVSYVGELESAYAAAKADSDDRDRKASAGNASLPVLSARGAAVLGNIAAVPVMGFAGGVPGLYVNWLFGLWAICLPQIATIYPASRASPDRAIYEPYQTALGIATSLAGAIAAVQIGQIASTAAYSNDVDFYGSLALLGSSLLSSLTHVRTACHKIGARQAKSAVARIAERLEEARALVRAEVGPFPVAHNLSVRVSKVDARIWLRFEATAPIPPQTGAGPAL